MVNTIYPYRIGYDKPPVFVPLLPYESLFPYDDHGDGECENGQHDHEVSDKEKGDGGMRMVSGVRSLL